MLAYPSCERQLHVVLALLTQQLIHPKEGIYEVSGTPVADNGTKCIQSRQELGSDRMAKNALRTNLQLLPKADAEAAYAGMQALRKLRRKTSRQDDLPSLGWMALPVLHRALAAISQAPHL